MTEELPVEEVLTALEEYQQRTIDLYLENEDDPETCVKALVRLHLEWTEEDPDRAIMVSRYRGPVMAGPGKDRLTASNASFFEQSKRWMDRATGSGRMLPVSFNVLLALVFAAPKELTQLWLGGRLKKQPTEYAEAMGEAAWAGILAAGKTLELSR